MGYRGRDVEVTFADGLCVVVACDSCGAIGGKELDVIRVPPYISGRFTTRVALFEVLTTGVQPRIGTVAICNEPNPTGEEILRGVRDELNMAGVGPLPIAISCEKNMPTKQTGLGITLVGMGEVGDLRIAATKPRDNIFCLGVPKVGSEVDSPDDPEIVQAEHLRLLLKERKVHDIIPVGSQGILGEIHILATALNLSFIAANRPDLGQFLDVGHNSLETPNIRKSGGPATCVIFTAEPGFEHDFKLIQTNQFRQAVPISWLGSFQK